MDWRRGGGGMDVDWGRLFTGWWLSDSIARICLAFFCHTNIRRRAALAGHPQRGPGPPGPGGCVLARVCSEMSDRLKEHTGRANDRWMPEPQPAGRCRRTRQINNWKRWSRWSRWSRSALAGLQPVRQRLKVRRNLRRLRVGFLFSSSEKSPWKWWNYTNIWHFRVQFFGILLFDKSKKFHSFIKAQILNLKIHNYNIIKSTFIFFPLSI